MLGVMTDDALSQQPWTRPHVILLAARTLLLLRLYLRCVDEIDRFGGEGVMRRSVGCRVGTVGR